MILLAHPWWLVAKFNTAQCRGIERCYFTFFMNRLPASRDGIADSIDLAHFRQPVCRKMALKNVPFSLTGH
jgi:hypothetical protein